MKNFLSGLSLEKKYLTYQFLTHMWFVSAVWLYFYRIFITDQEVGVMDGIAFLIGLIAEVPSGALADKFGKARLVKVGQLLVGAGFIVQAFSTDFIGILVGQSILMIGAAFASGADEALFFEKLNYDRSSTQWRSLLLKGTRYALIGGIIATLLGGVAHTVNPMLPWIFTGLSFVCAVIIISGITDVRSQKVVQSIRESFREYIHNIRSGFSHFLHSSLIMYVPIILILEGIFYAAGWGILRPLLLDRFEFSAFMGSVVLAVAIFVTAILVTFVDKFSKHITETLMFFAVAVSLVVVLIMSAFPSGVWGLVVIIVFYAGGRLLTPFMSEAINYHTKDEVRATVLSVASFLGALPYIVLAPLLGYLSDRGGLSLFFIIWALLVCVALAIYLYLSKKSRSTVVV
jgi:MFS family permease